MVFGALICAGSRVREIDTQIKALREKHGYLRELKWTKLSRLDLPFYRDLFNFIHANEHLRFKAVLVPDKSLLDHEKYNDGSASDFYYKIAFFALRDFIVSEKTYRLYMDYMDTLGRSKIRKLKTVLMSCKPKTLEAQTIRSHESQLIQVCDLLIGAICYANRTDIDMQSPVKTEVIAMISNCFGIQLDRSTPKYVKKFNLFKINLNTAHVKTTA